MTTALRSLLAAAAGLALVAGAVAPALAAPAPAPAPASVAAPTETSVAAASSWSVVPADAAGPDGRVSLRHDLEPGQSVSDHIAVTNLGEAEAVYSVVAGDGIVGSNGAFDIRAGEAEGSGGWVELAGLADGAVAVPPGETRVLPVTVAVPSDATPGDHPAGIVVGLASTETEGVTVQTRIGVRLHLRVLGDVSAGLSVGSVDARFEPSLNPFAPGRLTVAYELSNTGNVRVGSEERVSASGPFELAATRASGEPLHELLPDDGTRRTVTVDAWPTLLLLGAVDTVPLVVGDDTWDADLAGVRAEFQVLAVSWTQLAIVLAAIGLVVLLVLRRRRSQR